MTKVLGNQRKTKKKRKWKRKLTWRSQSVPCVQSTGIQHRTVTRRARHHEMKVLWAGYLSASFGSHWGWVTHFRWQALPLIPKINKRVQSRTPKENTNIEMNIFPACTHLLSLQWLNVCIIFSPKAFCLRGKEILYVQHYYFHVRKLITVIERFVMCHAFQHKSHISPKVI